VALAALLFFSQSFLTNNLFQPNSMSTSEFEQLELADYEKQWTDWNQTDAPWAGKLSDNEIKTIADGLYNIFEKITGKDTLLEQISEYESVMNSAAILFLERTEDIKRFEREHKLDFKPKDLDYIAKLANMVETYTSLERGIERYENVLKPGAKDSSGEPYDDEAKGDAKKQLMKLNEEMAGMGKAAEQIESIRDELAELEGDGARKISDKLLDDGGLLDEIGYYRIAEQTGELWASEASEEESEEGEESEMGYPSELSEYEESEEERGSSLEEGPEEEEEEAIKSRAAGIQEFLTALKARDLPAYNAVKAALMKSSTLMKMVKQGGGRRRRSYRRRRGGRRRRRSSRRRGGRRSSRRRSSRRRGGRRSSRRRRR